MSPIGQTKNELIKALKSAAKLTTTLDDITAPESQYGDLALACFKFSKEHKQTPSDAAIEISAKLNSWAQKNETVIAHTEAVGPYINIHLKRSEFSAGVIKTINREKENFGGNDTKQGKHILLEYVSPNTNKPLHLGHLRNATLGWSISKLLNSTGSRVTKTQIINDRGIHIMKSLLSYQRWSNGETPENTKTKGDKFVGKYYVKFSEEAKKDPKLEEEVQALLRQWESGDKELRKLWRQMNKWAEAGLAETCERIGISFDRIDFESNIYEEGRDLVQEATKNKLANKRTDGSIVVDLTDEGLDEKVLLRADGTTVYVTQDLALAKRRLSDLHPDLLLYIVGQEQEYHFKVLFLILERLKIASTEKLKHLSYHLVTLPDGRMKSREGTVVWADDLLDNLNELATKELKKRNDKLSTREIRRRAEIIALAAAKFYLLRVRPNSDIKFNPKESIAFTGRTGPYLLYTFARIESIFRKSKKKLATIKPPKNISMVEWQIILSLANYPEEVVRATEAYDPSFIADYAYALTKKINDFYETEPVLKAEPKLRAWRLQLLKNSQQVLGNALDLLGIEPLEEM